MSTGKTVATGSSILDGANPELEVLGGVRGVGGTATTISMLFRC